MPFRETLDAIDITTAGDRSYSATEDSAERGFTQLSPFSDPVTYRDLGRADGIDDDGVGDIADEGRGHRG